MNGRATAGSRRRILRGWITIMPIIMTPMAMTAGRIMITLQIPRTTAPKVTRAGITEATGTTAGMMTGAMMTAGMTAGTTGILTGDKEKK